VVSSAALLLTAAPVSPASAGPATAHVLRSHDAGHVTLVPFTVASSYVFHDAGAGADVAIIAVRNTGQEAASLLGTVGFLGAGGQVLDTLQASTVSSDEVQPGQLGYVRSASTRATGTASVTFTLTDSVPNETPDYVDLTATPGTASGTAHPLTVTNTGLRPSHRTHVTVVVRDPGGRPVDLLSAAGPADDLAPGASATFSFARSADPSGTTYLYLPDGSETAADVTYVSGVYDRKIVDHVARTTWTVLHQGAGGAPIAGATVNLLRYTQSTPPVSIGHGTTDARGHVSLPLRVDPSFIYTFLVEGGPTWAPDRYFHLTLNGDISLTVRKTSGPALRGRKVTFKGKESPAYPGEKVYLERRSGASWTSIGSARVSSSGSWRLTTRFARTGKVTLRVSSSPNAIHFGTSSSPLVVTVR